MTTPLHLEDGARDSPVGMAAALHGSMPVTPGHRQAVARIIARRQFRLAYQPVVSLADGSIRHHEALLRPEAPPGIARTPGEFVALAERAGLHAALDLAVIETASAMARMTGAAVAVNLSGLSASLPVIRDAVLHAATRLPAGHLLVEVTETAEITDIGAAAGSLARMRAAGVAVCLDDFGAGYASLRYARALPVDFIKIDGSFVHAAEAAATARAAIAAMQDVAEAAGAQTIAEMVETEAQAAVLRGLGVPYAQGWLFGRPGSIRTAEAAL